MANEKDLMLVVTLPPSLPLSVADALFALPFPDHIIITKFGGTLGVLASGTFTAQLKVATGTATAAITTAGTVVSSGALALEVLPGANINFGAITSVGVGAVGLTCYIWFHRMRE